MARKFYSPADLLEVLPERRIISEPVLDTLAGMNNGAVVSSTEVETYRFEGGIGEFL